MPETFLRLPEVLKKTGLSRSTLYSLVQKRKFPPPIKISERSSAWIKSDVDSWMQDRIEASRRLV